MKKIKDFFHHFFLPSETNNYRAKALHHDFLIFYLVLAISFSLIFKTSFFSKILGVATDITVEKLYQLTNEQRLKHGLKPLLYSEKLAKAAEEKAKDMFLKNYWAHYAPDGTTPWDFILASGYQYEYAGENLAKDFLFSENVVSAWMNSPTHRENILRPYYEEVGFAVVNGVLNGQETTLVVQLFGKPINKKSLALNQTSSSSPHSQITPSSPPLNLQKKPVLAQNSLLSSYKKPSGVITPKKMSFNYGVILFVFLSLVLFADIYFAYRIKLIRVTGKNLFHLMFILSFLTLFIFSLKGSII